MTVAFHDAPVLRSTGFPWGWGADRVETATAGFQFPCCWYFVKEGEEVGVHVFPDGERRCSPCAERFCRERMKGETR